METTMRTRLTIGTRMLSVFGVLTLLTAALAALGLWGLSQAERREASSHQDAHQTIELIDAARSAQVHFKIQLREWKDTLLWGFKQEDFDRHLAAFGKEEGLAKAELRRAAALMVTQGIDARTVLQTIASHQELGVKYRAALEHYDRGRPDSYRMVDGAVRGIDRAPSASIDQIIEAVQQHASTTRGALEEASRVQGARVRSLILAGLGIWALVALGLSVVAVRSVTVPVMQAMIVAEQIATGDLSARVEASGEDELSRMLASLGKMSESLRRAIGQAKAGANTLASAADEIVIAARHTVLSAQQQATAIQETTTSTAELTETVRVTGQRASEVQLAMDRTNETSQGLRAELGEAQNVLGVTREEMRTIVGSIQGVLGRNQQIGEIIENVRDVADQTQLLAVNAGIEAAKAGEFGRGFSVVASEMKALADQSKKAAQRIRDIVAEVQSGTAEAVHTVETSQGRVHEALLPLGAMIPKVEQLTLQVDESGQSLRQILAIVQQQTIGIDQINQAIKVVQEAVQDGLLQNMQLESAAEGLNGLARRLNESVAAYRF
jgi:methyl-accepting chemotaxis protein